MGDLTDKTGVPLKMDNKKKNGLIRDHFGWRNDGRKVDEMEEERERYPGLTGISQEKMEELVRKALAGTSNRSAPGPDGIGYKLIKRVLDLKLGSELIREVAENLIKGRIPKEWQHSKVVMIPKPGKDHSKTKGWRPINLINCIGKLGEKVVADRLQESGLLHRHQFGSVKGRSATEAALRVVTRAQRCMAAEGAVGWNFWDVKGGFQNVREEDVIRELEKSEEGKKWIPWVKEFFRAREFDLEWDGKIQGKGKTNIGAPQGSPLSLVIFLIWMAPIITKMEEALKSKWPSFDLELPSYVDDLHLRVSIWDKIKARGIDMEGILDEADKIINRIAAENHLPLEDSKHEKLVLRNNRRKKNKGVKWVKWLSIIMNESLTFTEHWKAQIKKARAMLAQFNGLGNSQWGISATS